MTDWEKERKFAALWPAYVRRGCLVCGSTKNWCPDCHTCTSCGQGCDECFKYRKGRRNYHYPSHKPTQPRR